MIQYNHRENLKQKKQKKKEVQKKMKILFALMLTSGIAWATTNIIARSIGSMTLMIISVICAIAMETFGMIWSIKGSIFCGLGRRR